MRKVDTMLMRLSEAQNHRCCYCSVEMTFDIHCDTSVTRDHVIPRVFNGQTEWDNLVAACERCNNLRGNMEAYHFHALMLAGDFDRLWNARVREHGRLDRRFARKAIEDIKVAWLYIDWQKRSQAWA